MSALLVSRRSKELLFIIGNLFDARFRHIGIVLLKVGVCLRLDAVFFGPLLEAVIVVFGLRLLRLGGIRFQLENKWLCFFFFGCLLVLDALVLGRFNFR